MLLKQPKFKLKLPFDWHKHPFAIPVLSLLFLSFGSMVGFVLLNGQTLKPTDSKVVHLFVDGDIRVLPTRAQNVGEVIDKAGIELNEGDVVEPVLDSPIIDQDFNINVYRAKPVTVVADSGQKISARVVETNPAEMAKAVGVNVFPEDVVKFADPDNALEDGVIGAQVVIDRALNANINLYGNNIPTRTHAATVGDLLGEKGIKTLPDDTIVPALDTKITENIQVFITTIGKQIVSVEEEIAPPEVKEQDINAPAGTVTVKDPGAPGKRVVTYEIQLENGQEVGRKAIQEFIASQPRKRVVAEGTKVVISNPSENVLIGQQLAAAKGWNGEQWHCLYQLWQKESRWNHLAGNRSSGAYGIPQSLPGSKMASAGADWLTNPSTQIKWGLGYIERVYGSPCGAWQKSRSSGWY